MNLWRIEDGRLILDLHAGQTRAWESTRRIVCMSAGTQGGKTSLEPWWLAREIQRKGPGDYIAATGTYDLFKLKFLPVMRECFEHVLRIGRYWASERLIELADPTTGHFLAKRADDLMWGRIILRSADTGGGLESTTAQAAVLDEAGLPTYTLETYEAVRRRLSLSRGRILIGTTLYALNWLKTHILDAAAKGDPELDVIHFDSIANPAFPREEYEIARRKMPGWRFNMRYRGRATRPPGMIYECFDEADVMAPVAIPRHWPRWLGLDFGGVHTAALFYAQEPHVTPPQYTLYREYLAGGRTAIQHTQELLRGEPRMPRAIGGSKSEGQWRQEFGRGGWIEGVEVPGLAIAAPKITDVELGITRVYGVHARHGIRVFDTCEGYLDQKRSYARALDANQEPTEAIDAKSTYHFMDAERYVIGGQHGSDWVEPGPASVQEALTTW
jgi:hypothetical protein